MPNIFDISQANPTKFYQQSDLLGLSGYTQFVLKSFEPNQNERGIDADFFYRNIKSYMDAVKYWQPYQQGDKLTLQWLGVKNYTSPTLNNYKVKIIDENGNIVKESITTQGAEVGTGSGIFIRSCIMLLYDVPEGKYFVQLHKIGLFSDYDFFVLAEPIWVKPYWENTVLLRYKHSKNAYGIFWETGIEMWKRIFANFTEIQPGSNFNVYADQPQNLRLLSGVKFRDKQLTVGVDGNYVTEYEIDMLEEISLCDTLYIDHVLHTRTEGSKFDMARVDKNPLVTANVILRETLNDNDLIVGPYEPIVLGTAPESEWFYVPVLTQTTPATTYTIGQYFNGAANFVNYLNCVNIGGSIDYVNTYFAIDSANRIVLITNNSAVYAAFQPGFIFQAAYQRHLILDVDTNLGSAMEVKLNSAVNRKFAYFWGDGTKTTGTGTVVTTSKTYSPGKKYRAFLFWNEHDNMRIDGSDPIITSIEGKLSSLATYFDAGGLPITEVRNNIFEYCTADLAQVKFDFCKLTTYKVNDLIRYAYEAKLTGAFSGSAVLNFNLQQPAAPPSVDSGITFFIDTLTSAGVTVVTD